MAKLEIEITDELMGEIEAAAKKDLVTPEHWAACRLSVLFRDKEFPKWATLASPLLQAVIQALESFAPEKAVSKQ